MVLHIINLIHFFLEVFLRTIDQFMILRLVQIFNYNLFWLIFLVLSLSHIFITLLIVCISYIFLILILLLPQAFLLTFLAIFLLLFGFLNRWVANIIDIVSFLVRVLMMHEQVFSDGYIDSCRLRSLHRLATHHLCPIKYETFFILFLTYLV